MKTELLDLSTRIERELKDIERIVWLALDAWQGADRFPEQQEHFLSSECYN